jgi:hypothetical protein
MRAVAIFVLVSAFATIGRGYRPARFADRPPVVEVADDAPIPVPRRREMIEPIYLAEIYVRRPLMDALDPERYPDAQDVNAYDEVPRSSWFEPHLVDATAMAVRPRSVGIPMPPLVVLGDRPDGGRGGFAIEDARGVRYELRVDPAGRPGMRTAAAAIASRLVWALGLRTPEVLVTSVSIGDFAIDDRSHGEGGAVVDFEAILRSGAPPVDGRFRVSAMAWPVGLDLGVAPIAFTRGDDPNDRVPHRDRRTQRALKVIGAWLKLAGLGPKKTLDAYVGPPGRGHVEHYLVGLDDALGADDVVAPGPPDRERGSTPLLNLVSFGFAHAPARPPTQRRWLAVGDFDDEVDAAGFSAPQPFEPMDRTLAADGYWAAKRIASLSHDAIAAAVGAGGIDDPEARAYVISTLEARRRNVVRYWYGRVTPLEVERSSSDEVVVRDRGIADGIADAAATSYEVAFLDPSGRELAPRARWRPPGPRFRIPIPPEARPAPYLVVNVVASRDGAAAPRGFEVHLVARAGGREIVGVRH